MGANALGETGWIALRSDILAVVVVVVIDFVGRRVPTPEEVIAGAKVGRHGDGV